MEKVSVILKEDVLHLGRGGDTVHVKPGYARNYLLPRGMAVRATRKNMNQLAHEKKLIEQRLLQQRKDIGSLAQKLQAVVLQFERQVGQEDKLFGSVTSRDIEEALTVEGISIDRKKIHLEEPIRSLGQYNVPIKLSSEVTAEVKLWVVAK